MHTCLRVSLTHQSHTMAHETRFRKLEPNFLCFENNFWLVGRLVVGWSVGWLVGWSVCWLVVVFVLFLFVCCSCCFFCPVTVLYQACLDKASAFDRKYGHGFRLHFSWRYVRALLTRITSCRHWFCPCHRQHQLLPRRKALTSWQGR